MRLIQGDCLEVLKTLPDNSVDAVVTDPPYGLKFMGKKWDYEVPSVETWREIMRVLKHGGHALVACGTRTQHRMALNIEDAGFEIRDVITWLYGSGFPKSLNVGKQTGLKEHEGLGTALKPSAEFWTLARKPLSEKTVAANVLKFGTGAINVDGCRVESGLDYHDLKVTQGANRKMAFGLLSSRFKPAQGRFPANLILGCDCSVLCECKKPAIVTDDTYCFRCHLPTTKALKKGHAHLSTCAVFKLDEQSGILKTGAMNSVSKESPNNSMSGKNYSRVCRAQASSGGASRFFYCAKASKSERNAGLEGMPERDRSLAISQWDNQTNGCGEVMGPSKPQANHHPTVKPIKLMQYLCRLITPPNGIVLDPFMGSGSTGVAAKNEGFDFIGIEREKEYKEIAEKRIEAVML